MSRPSRSRRSSNSGSKSKSISQRASSPVSLADGADRNLTAFGERLVMALQSKGMSDSELAKALGIAQPNIHTLKYKTDRPRYSTVVKIAKVLGVSPEVLMPATTVMGAMTAAEGTKVYLVIESKQGRQTIRLA